MIYTIEELAINDSFIAWCSGQNEKGAAFWNDYLQQHPEQLLTLEEARKLVLELTFMLQKKQHELSADSFQPKHGLYAVPGKALTNPFTKEHPGKFSRRKKVWIAAAAIILLLGTGAWLLYQPPIRQSIIAASTPAPLSVPAPGDNIRSKKGEYKTLILADGTKVTMNAQSELSVSDGFGTKDRNVRLTGEAFFEVAHNRQLPFIVQVAKYKIKAVGTKFNVKAYSNDRYSETSLLEGKVQILVNNRGQDEVYKTLRINQKFVLNDSAAAATRLKKQEVVPLSYDDANQNIETAWVDHFLAFDNTPLTEIKNILERKYNTTIVIANTDVAKYRYTASFQNESIDDVLKALQLSYPFSYKKDGTKIIITK